MPTVLRDECKQFVDTYGADIIALLVRDVDPAKVCELIRLCPKPKDVAFLTKPNAQTCGLCDYISTYLLAGHPIENVCKHFSTDNGIKDQCEILVHLYKPNMCSQLPLCFDDTTPEIPEQLDEPAASVECSLCKYIVAYVDAVIQNNKSEAAIESALEKVCSIVPHALNATCVQFAVTYGPILVQLIEKYGAPDKVCDAIQTCKNGTNALLPGKYIEKLSLTLIMLYFLFS
jgi:saposin